MTEKGTRNEAGPLGGKQRVTAGYILHVATGLGLLRGITRIQWSSSKICSQGCLSLKKLPSEKASGRRVPSGQPVWVTECNTNTPSDPQRLRHQTHQREQVLFLKVLFTTLTCFTNTRTSRQEML